MMVTGDYYMCSHVKTPTAGKCWECAEVRAKDKASRKLAQSEPPQDTSLDEILRRFANDIIQSLEPMAKSGYSEEAMGMVESTSIEKHKEAKAKINHLINEAYMRGSEDELKCVREGGHDDIRKCFRDTYMQTEGDTELFDTEETIKAISAWHKAEIAKLFEQIRNEARDMIMPKHVTPWVSGEYKNKINDTEYHKVKAIDVEALTRLEGIDA